MLHLKPKHLPKLLRKNPTTIGCQAVYLYINHTVCLSNFNQVTDSSMTLRAKARGRCSVVRNAFNSEGVASNKHQNATA